MSKQHLDTQLSLTLRDSQNRDLFYIFDIKPKGFTIVSADDAAIPVLGYSLENVWDANTVPPQLTDMLENWKRQMIYIKDHNLAADASINQEWSRLSIPMSSFRPITNYRNVSPLLTTIWGQGTYYNAQCPSGTPVGCVATAMAQIMKFWAYPAVGNGSHSYVCSPYGTLTANFGTTTYNWSTMPNNVTSANTAVATISFHAGVAVNMQYAPGGSGAYSTDVAPALVNYFKYASTAHYYDKSSYSSTTWETMMKGELDLSRPVYYSGSGPAGGHSFVLDGYQSSNFHVNWGWNGSYNGYFSLSNLNPGGDTFNNGQAAVIGIKPLASNPYYVEGFEGTTFPPTGWTVTASTFARSATNYISGAYSARYNATGTGTALSGKQLITPLITVNASTPDLVFKARAGTTLRAEEIKVGYSTSQSGPFTYLANAILSTSAQTFTRVVNGITPGNYYFVFETYSSNSLSNSKTWIIDDVTGILGTTPTTASINMSSWSAGTLSPGDEARSGDIFSLSNLGSGTLTITSVTSLSGTEFTTNFNPNVQLVYGQTHDFGFTYDPLDYNTDNVSFQIVTNAGTITIALSGSAAYATFYDGFENYSNFTLSFPPWTQYDGDGLATYGVTGYSWTNSGYTGAWMVFNPSMTSPTMASSYPAFNGSKYASCWAAMSSTVSNNDWLISPEMTLSSAGTVSFYAKAFSGSYSERMKVLYSTTTNAQSAFTNYLAGSASTYVTISSTTWTLYSYAIPQTAKYIAIQCVSLDAFALLIDDFKVMDNTTPPTPFFGNLSGYVYASGTTNPISNALVTVGTKQCYTDALGHYQINNIMVGSISANCSAPGMFYHAASISGIAITNGNTTTQNFGLTWGELAANPTSVTANLYQGEVGSASVVLSNPGGTANTAYAGYFTGSARGITEPNPFIRDNRKPSPDANGVRIHRITDTNTSDRSTSWFSYGSISDADYYSGAQTERGNLFVLSDFALMDGAVTISQLRGYFYNPSSAAWTTTTHRTFAWKIYSVSPSGTVSVLHTSSNILLPSISTNTYTLSEYTLPTAVTIPAGYNFIVTVKPSSGTDTSGRPQTLATSLYTDNGVSYSSTNGWASMGMDILLDAYVTGTEWLTSYNFEGSIVPGGTATLPLNFLTDGVTAGAKNAYMYVYNDANYTAPSPRGDAMVIPITLNITVATTPIAVITTGTSWTTNATLSTPSSSGDVFTLKNIGPGNLTITSISGLTGTPFTTNFNTGISIPQNGTYSFGFTFSPTVTGIYTTTFTIVTNGGTKTITLKGYGNYIYESFEGTNFPPDGWQSVDNDNDTYNWYQYTVSGSSVAHAGTYCAGSASWISSSKSADPSIKGKNSSRTILYPDNWLITPRLAVPTGGLMNFWIAAQDPSYPAENYSVKLSTTNNSLTSFTTTLLTETLADGAWHFKEIDLSAYAGQNIYIAFQHHSCFDQFVLKLDDLYLPPLAAPLQYGNLNVRVGKFGLEDPVVGATVTVGSRTGTTDAVGVASFIDMVVDTYDVSVSKTGYVSQTSPVTLIANSTVSKDFFLNWSECTITQTNYTITQAPNSEDYAVINIHNNGTATLNWEAASGVWGGDTILSTALNQDFEAEDFTGWSGSLGPNSDIYTGYGHEGGTSSKTFVFSSYGTTSVQWLITPKLHVQNGDALTFWYKQFNNSSETVNIMISTTDNSIASFTTSFAVVGPLSDTNWAQFNQSLSAYAGTDIYIGFNYPRVDNYQYGYFLVDQITGPQAWMPPRNWLTTDRESGDLGAGISDEIVLIANSAGLPLGTYTAQTWIFSNGIVSPVKLYVTMNVVQAGPPAVPQGVSIVKGSEGVELSWNTVDGAVNYKIYASADPITGYNYLKTATTPPVVITVAELATAGYTDKCFFKVTADNAARTTISTIKKSSKSMNAIAKLKPKHSKQAKLLIK